MSTTMGSVGTWLLGGALLASLGWNVMTLRPATSSGGGCVEAVRKLEAAGVLGITEEKKGEVIALLRACDAQSTRDDARAAELAQEIRRMLRDPSVDPAAIRARAEQLGAVRAAAVAACVTSSLELRRLLTPAQVGQLLDACCGDEYGSSCGGGR